jgi:hypothetical protein
MFAHGKLGGHLCPPDEGVRLAPYLHPQCQKPQRPRGEAKISGQSLPAVKNSQILR